MAKNEQKKLGLKVLEKDANILASLKGIKNYQSSNPNYSLENMQKLFETLQNTAADHVQAHARLKTASDIHTAAQWAFHNAILECKFAVKAQFGRSSNEIQAMGLKKPEDYKGRKRKGKSK